MRIFVCRVSQRTIKYIIKNVARMANALETSCGQGSSVDVEPPIPNRKFDP